MHVLYATDGRPSASAAGEFLLRVADPQRVRFTVLHVDDYGNEEVADRFAERALGSAVELLGDGGYEVQPQRTRGNTKRAIEEALQTGAYDLAVVGAGNAGWLGRLILGGVSTSVLHESSIPTLVVARAPVETRDRTMVVVGTDGSASASQAIGTLLSLTAPATCEIFVRSVEDDVAVSSAGIDVGDSPEAEASKGSATGSEAAEQHLQQALDRFARAGFPTEGDVVRGSPAVRIMEAVEQRDADLAVLGSRGLGRIASVGLGSVSAHVVRHSPASLVGKHAAAT